MLTIPANSPAVDLVTPCSIATDQRGFARFTTQGQPCDAGAYEQSAVGGGPGAGADPDSHAGADGHRRARGPDPGADARADAGVPAIGRGRAGQRHDPRPPAGEPRLRRADRRAGDPARIDRRRQAGVVEIAVGAEGGRESRDGAVPPDGIFRVTQSRGITDLKLVESSRRARGAAPAPRSASRRPASCGARAAARSGPPATTAPRPSAAPNGSSRTPAPARSRASRRASSPSATTSRRRRSSCAARAGSYTAKPRRALNFWRLPDHSDQD